MILAIMHGGPQDGAEVAVHRVEPLAFPVCSVEFPMRHLHAEPPGPAWDVLIYVPEMDTLRPCPCRPDCPHATCHFRYRPPHRLDA